MTSYIFTGGAYREFRGYVFANGKPTTIRDSATVEALKRMPEFKPYEPPPPAVIRKTLRLKKHEAQI